jgi:hypothetical protein
MICFKIFLAILEDCQAWVEHAQREALSFKTCLRSVRYFIICVLGIYDAVRNQVLRQSDKELFILKFFRRQVFSCSKIFLKRCSRPKACSVCLESLRNFRILFMSAGLTWPDCRIYWATIGNILEYFRISSEILCSSRMTNSQNAKRSAQTGIRVNFRKLSKVCVVCFP